MKQKKFHGVIVPLVTPFDQTGNIDRKSVDKLISHILEAEAFPFVLGTTGESLSMTIDMRIDLVKMVAKQVGGSKTLYAGISDNALKNTLFVANKYFDLGVDVLVAHLPSYYPIRSEHIKKYFLELAEQSPLPVMIYNIPGTTHISIPLEVIDELCDHPNICGLKDSERSLERMNILGDKFSGRPDFVIMSGWTNQSAQAFIFGFDGIVPSTANVIPKMFTELYQNFCTGNLDAVRNLQDKIDPWADLHQKEKMLCDVIPALKIMLNEAGICRKNTLPPLMDLSENEEVKLRAGMKLLAAKD